MHARLADQRQMLLALADDLVHRSHGNADVTEAAHGGPVVEIIRRDTAETEKEAESDATEEIIEVKDTGE